MVREEHITVIRKAPKNFLNVKTEVDPITSFGTTSTDQTFLVNPQNPVQGNVIAEMTMPITLFIPTASSPPSQGDVVLFNPSSSTSLPNDEYQVKATITTLLNSGYKVVLGNNGILGTFSIWEITIQSIDSLVLSTGLEYNWAVQIDPQVKKFKNKFTRFSYRYKYEDGEHSTFAPFTNVVFEPEAFKYDVKEAFNLGMENAITKITLSDYNVNIPEDVVGIDILYKESDSPVVYIVDTIDSISGLTSPTHSYEIKPNQIKAALPSNQLLRAWDNVPKRSLAQEISGNRIIYGNYFQNYDLQEAPKIMAELEDRENCNPSNNNRSLKSIRNYSLGVSYLDKYGRQTPVFTNREADIDILIDRSDDFNQVSSKIIGSVPDWAKYYKVFVKETSSEYYNLAMDRIYEARDGNIWLSFPSSDRNKVDEKTFLILKKGVEGAQPVNEKNRYKVLAIENEAPEFIKTELRTIGTVREDATTDPFGANGPAIAPPQYFVDPGNYPTLDRTKIVIKKSNWDAVGLALESFDKLEVKFSILLGGLTQISQTYEVVNFASDTTVSPSIYTLILAKPIEEAYLTDPGNAVLPDPSIGITIYEKKVENRPEFDGRFFVKVSRDININTYIVSQATASLVNQQEAGVSLPFYYLSNSGAGFGSNTAAAVGTAGNATNTKAEWEAFHTQTSSDKSCWFIDEAWYAWHFPPSETSYLNNNGLSYFGCNADNYAAVSGVSCGSTGSVGSFAATAEPASKKGYNKGIWTDSNGQTWLYLSFGYIKHQGKTGYGTDTSLGAQYPSSSHIALANGCAPWEARGNTGTDVR
jgi:hypothetical protein